MCSLYKFCAISYYLYSEAKGYYFGDRFEPGISIFTFDRQDTSSDRVALGFMTWKPNGTLIRLDSDTSPDFIEARLVRSDSTFDV